MPVLAWKLDFGTFRKSVVMVQLTFVAAVGRKRIPSAKFNVKYAAGWDEGKKEMKNVARV